MEIAEKTFVKTDDGTILVQIPDNSRWGFYLATDDQSWPGGFGIASSWETISHEEAKEALAGEKDSAGYDLYETLLSYLD